MAGQPTWQELVARHDETAHGKMVDYIAHITTKADIPPLYRELLLFAGAAAIRYRISMQTHARRALAAGATSDQLFQAGALVALSTGFTTMIEVVQVLRDLDASPDG
ncbi:carboxymuconolactone decarboxylase family protein [Actinophytocola sp.]|uniref:carboxymuconolactone decarboxylase family protein n=1 Tax=Actinophytocola sp. TaxID=1872138 RepID=UPI003D6B4801